MTRRDDPHTPATPAHRTWGQALGALIVYLLVFIVGAIALAVVALAGIALLGWLVSLAVGAWGWV